MIENPARYCTEHCDTQANKLFFSKRFARYQLADRQQQDVQWEHPQERDAKPVDDLHFMPSLIQSLQRWLHAGCSTLLSAGSKGSPEIAVAALPGTELLEGDFLELAGELEIEGTVFFSIAVPSDSRHFDFDPTIALVRLV